MRSAFFRQMAIITALLLLTLTTLGLVLRFAFGTYLGNQREQTLSESMDSAVQLTRAYGDMDSLKDNWDYQMSLNLAARVSGLDMVLCDRSGSVVVCACGAFACSHMQNALSPEQTAEFFREGAVYLEGRLPGLYNEQRYICVRAFDEGILILSSPVRMMARSAQGLFALFFYPALVIWLIAMVATFFLSRREARPLREMAVTARRFGHGDLSARVRVHRSNTREMDELVSAFNHMADTLERSDRQRQEFVANLSHELKTPMTTIAGYLDGMLDGTIPPQQHPQYMQVVLGEVRRMSRLVRSMLEISRMQAEGMDESKLSRFDLADTAAQVLLSFEQEIRKKNIEVDLQLPDRALYTTAHRDGIMQVLYNLMENAVKFCNSGGRLTIVLQQGDGKYRLSIRNTGPVIPEEELPLIFDRFHKLDRSRSKDPDGVGLGLYIVKTILGAHNENIWVESHDGETVFTFTLPMAK